MACTVADEPRADPSGTVAGFADATGRFLPLVCTLNATKVTDSVARLLGVTPEEFDALALSAPAGADGLVLVPHFDGERTPNRPAATGTLVGIGNDVSPANLARAAVEGVVCNLLGGVDSLVTGDRTSGQRVFLIGGGARSAAYRQIAADLLGAPVIVPSESELVASGAAVQAAALFHGCGFDALGGGVEPRSGGCRRARRRCGSCGRPCRIREHDGEGRMNVRDPGITGLDPDVSLLQPRSALTRYWGAYEGRRRRIR